MSSRDTDGSGPLERDVSRDVELEIEILSPSPKREPADSDALTTTRKARILVVDADPALRAYTCRCIERSCNVAADVSELDDAAAACYVIDTERVDLIVCEINLAPMSGFDLVDMLRSEPKRRKIPVILTSGAAISRADRNRARRLAGVSLVDAPFSARTLCSHVRVFLGGEAY